MPSSFSAITLLLAAGSAFGSSKRDRCPGRYSKSTSVPGPSSTYMSATYPLPTYRTSVASLATHSSSLTSSKSCTSTTGADTTPTRTTKPATADALSTSTSTTRGKSCTLRRSSNTSVNQISTTSANPTFPATTYANSVASSTTQTKSSRPTSILTSTTIVSPTASTQTSKPVTTFISSTAQQMSGHIDTTKHMTTLTSTTRLATKPVTSFSSTTESPPPTYTAQPTATQSATGHSGSDSLNARFAAKGKEYWGTCADFYTLDASHAQNVDIIESQFGCLTPENSAKWDATEPKQGQFSFNGMDQVIAFAQKHHKMVRGHTLVWHAQLPQWVKDITDKNTLTQVIQNHVTTLVTRYKGKIAKWDVVNEILNEDGTLRDSVFHNVLGEEFVRIAFEAARNADPSAKLYINDYNINDGSYSKTKAMAKHVKKWRESGIPIDGIGSQCHLSASGFNSAGGVFSALQLLGSAASEVAITELDISTAPPDAYVTVAGACLNTQNCVGITTWGVADKDSWVSQNHPLLYDDKYKPKPAYFAVMNELV